jgi:arylsulfatase A-like enzyme
MPEPFFAVLHYSNTHFPYRIDPADAPFQPQSDVVSRTSVDALRNRYFDALYLQDKTTAAVIRAVRALPSGERTIIVFVSDHGESFYEHDVVIHESSVFDTELRVPAWIDAPPGTLAPSELSSLTSLESVPVTEIDLAPTLLDLLHLEDEQTWQAWLAAMPGTSLLRGHPRDRVDAIGTCNELWSCFVPAWGLLRGDQKYVFRASERGFRCYDTSADPGELHDLGDAGCRNLDEQMQQFDARERSILLGH